MDGRAEGIIVRNQVTGKLEAHAADAVVLATGGYSNVFFLSTNAKGCSVSAAWQAYRKGACFANPCFTQIHPTCIPVSGDYQSKLTLMSESLRNDGRIWVSKKQGDVRTPGDIPENERDYYLEERYPSFGNLVPRDVASRNAKGVCDEGRGVGESGLGVYLDFADAIQRMGEDQVRAKYGNLFHMYQKITDENPYQVPMRIYPALHYTMGGLWVDYNLMSNVDGLFVLGEANFSDHGANRLGASALMQGLADGYFVIPYTISNYLAEKGAGFSAPDHPEYGTAIEGINDKINSILKVKGKSSVDEIHRKLGLLMWENCGMAREEAGLKKALAEMPAIAEEFKTSVNVPGAPGEFNQTLVKALRLADFLEFGELMVRDALARSESCGGHFRLESQTEEGEALRDDENFAHVSAWEYKGTGETAVMHKEPLDFEYVKLTQRSYK